jgi:hypothetical protein
MSTVQRGIACLMRWVRSLVSPRSSLIQLSLQPPTVDGASYRKPKRGPDLPNRPPYDVDGGVREPKRWGPPGLSTSAAVAEPNDEEYVIATAATRYERPHSSCVRATMTTTMTCGNGPTNPSEPDRVFNRE